MFVLDSYGSEGDGKKKPPNSSFLHTYVKKLPLKIKLLLFLLSDVEGTNLNCVGVRCLLQYLSMFNSRLCVSKIACQ